MASQAVIEWPEAREIVFAGTEGEAGIIPLLEEAGFSVRRPSLGNLILEILRAAGVEARVLERAGEILGAEGVFAGQV